jgi:hypothetical protein
MNEKKKHLIRKKELYDYFVNYPIECPICHKLSNIELILTHIKTKKCLLIQNQIKILQNEDILNKKISAIIYNRTLLKNNYNYNNDTQNNNKIEDYLILK